VSRHRKRSIRARLTSRATRVDRANPRREGWEGWDDYAPFYDWENARTLGRRDVGFWRRVASERKGLVLELGCGTGRVSVALARSGVELIGIDRSAAMLDRAARRARPLRQGKRRGRLTLIRGDIRALPFRERVFSSVLAPYGVVQSLLAERDLTAALASIRKVLAYGGIFGLELVPDVPQWREYDNRVQLQGTARGGVHLTLIESVRQDRPRHRTTFRQRYIERRGGRRQEHDFDLTFRTLSVPQMTRRLERAGFEVDAVLGDYHGTPWTQAADEWIILARVPELVIRHAGGRLVSS
jgi:ubiquinone/menaquinone biosynthesis C-methylase UbiE